MATIIGIPTTRVGDLFIRQRLLNQMQADQLDLFRVQMQMSTGHRFQVPSEEPDAALRVISLQRLLERKDQTQTNLATNQSYLTATDAVLSSVSSNIAEIRGIALGVIDTIATQTQRDTVARQVQQMTQQLVDTGNQKFRGRYLFAGKRTDLQPFELADANVVRYQGDEGRLKSYSDIDLLFDTNLNGSEVFGAISEPVLGSMDLNPVLRYNTRLTDLNRGKGVAPGSIAISDGTNTSTIDLSNAASIGDVASLIRANPPQGKILDVQITATGLVITLIGSPGDLLTIREVGSGSTAADLGILTTTGVSVPAAAPSRKGDDLDPILRLTTPLNDILGVRSYALVASSGTDNDLIFEADTVGASFNGIEIHFVDDASVVSPGMDEVATYDSATRRLTVTVKDGATQAKHVAAAVQAAYAAGQVPITARLDPLDDQNGGAGVIAVPPPGTAAGTTANGSGTRFDQNMGLWIVNGEATRALSFADAQNIEDMLNTLNISGDGLLAEINEDATGINIRSRLSGADFMIGENGGSTAAQLGVRSFTPDTRLEDLNFDRGITAASGTDFTIEVVGSGVAPLQIDVSGLTTIGDVLDAINNYVDPGTGLTQTVVQARLALYGNGIELRDTTGNPAGSNTLTVQRAGLSRAAIQLGLIPEGQDSNSLATPAAPASTTIVSASPKSNLIFTANDPGTHANALQVVFQDGGAPGVTYDQAAGTLTFGIVSGTTTAADIVNLLSNSWVSAHFTATLDPTDNPPNDGSGLVDPNDGTAAPMAGGTATFVGDDVNPLETEGLFTALLRLQKALENNDLEEAQRAINLLDDEVVSMNFSRAELGARQQGLDVMQIRGEDENVILQTALSEDFDADLAAAISEFTGRQIAFEAALRTSAAIFQLTLLNYL